MSKSYTGSVKSKVAEIQFAQMLKKAVNEGNAEEVEKVLTSEVDKDGTQPRYGDRRISDELYDELRAKTPSKKIQKMVNKGNEIGAPDAALPGKTITGTLQADHIVPMDKITRMEGFDKLTSQQQIEVLNCEENFIGISEAANKSKGSKSFAEWTVYKKENIKVDPVFRQKMMEMEKVLERKLQKQIDDMVKLG